MLKKQYPYYLANQPQQPNAELEVIDKYSGDVVSHVAMADRGVIDCAIGAAAAAEEPMRRMKAYQRQAVLDHCVKRFRERFDELAEALCIEAGKPIKDAKGEVTRLIDTFRIAAMESVQLPGGGEVMPMDISERAGAYRGMWKRVPIGACSFITPFNFPLNLVAHKVAPAIAAGCPFVLKPAPATPIGALIIGEILAETELPQGAFSVLPTTNENAAPFVEDPRLKLLSFTGSQIGWDLRARAGKKKVVLELGGNAACLIDETITGDRLNDAVDRLIIGGYYQSGQSCISVQRIFVHRAIYDQMKATFVAKVKTLKAGDPRKEDTFIGPIISDREAARIEQWITAAVDRGAKVLCGGKRDGRLVEATVLEDVPADADVSCREIFGPVTMLVPFGDFGDAVDQINQSAYGLQAGVFTRDIGRAMAAWDRLDVGGILINDVPSFRVDHMPYGGVKNSGLGREGIRWAIEDMSEVRLLAIRDV